MHTYLGAEGRIGKQSGKQESKTEQRRCDKKKSRTEESRVELRSIDGRSSRQKKRGGYDRVEEKGERGQEMK